MASTTLCTLHFESPYQGEPLKKSFVREDIQGLRGISVLSVLLYHAWPKLIPGGFVGVDIFFVISGFVITSTILRDFAGEGFSFANFYRRRIRRIFPALYFMMFSVLAASWFLLPPYDYIELGKTALATVAFSSNVIFLKFSGYFDGPATLKPLLHTWSLAVEEQFYFLYPILLILVHRYSPKRLRSILVIFALASLTLSIWMLKGHPSATFYLAPPRAFELLIGGILACPPTSIEFEERTRKGLSLIGLSLILIALFTYDHKTPFPGPTALIPCLGAALIIWTGAKEGNSLGGRWISVRPLTFLGDLSYSLYLWHWPILVLAKHYFMGELSYSVTFLCLIASLGASLLSFHLIERPFLQKSRGQLPYLQLGFGTMMCAAILSVAIVREKGIPERFPPAARIFFAASEDYNHNRTACHSAEEGTIPYDRSCTFGAQGVTPDVAVWGDSHGAELAIAIGERLHQMKRSVMEITASACPPSIGYSSPEYSQCVSHNDDTLKHLVADSRIRTVILVVNFAKYKHLAYDSMLAGYRRSVEHLQAKGKHVVLVYPIPVYDFDPPSVLGMRSKAGLPLEGIGMPRVSFEQENKATVEFLNSIYRTGTMDRIIPEEQLCDSYLCRVYKHGSHVWYFNKSHLSLAGARAVASKIMF